MKLLVTFNHCKVNVIPTASGLVSTVIASNRLPGLFGIFLFDQPCLRKPNCKLEP